MRPVLALAVFVLVGACSRSAPSSARVSSAERERLRAESEVHASQLKKELDQLQDTLEAAQNRIAAARAVGDFPAPPQRRLKLRRPHVDSFPGFDGRISDFADPLTDLPRL